MNQNEVCNEHKQVFITVEFNLDGQQDFTQMCSVCVAQQMTQRMNQVNPVGKVLTLNDAYQCIEEIKEEFKQNQAVKVNTIKNALNELKNEIQMIQTKIKQTCDKLLENIHQMLENTAQSISKLDTKLKELLVLSPTELINQLRIIEQEFDYSKQSQLFKQLIDQLIIDDQLQNCRNIMKNEEKNEDKTLNSVQEKFKIKQTKSHKTPHLSIICEEHKTEIIYLDLSKDSKRSNRLCCLYCQFNSQIQFIPVKNVFEKWETYVKDVDNVMEYLNSFYGNKHSSTILTVDKLISYLLEKKSLIQEKLNQYLQVIISKKVEQYKQQYQIKNYESLSKDEVIQICSKLIHQYTSQQIKQMILDDFAEIDNEIINFLNDQILIPIIENTSKTLKQLYDNTKPIDETQKQIVIFEQQNQQNLQNEEITKRIQCQFLNQKSVESQTQFKYDLIMQIEEKEDCWCMLFNKDETLLVTCHDSKKIKIYEFTEKKLKLLQILASQTSKLFAIQIHNVSNQIIISDNKSIIIWNYQQEEKKWSQVQILQQHDDSINCLISNQEETMLISGGDDCKINYWCKQEDNAMLWMLQGSIVVHKTKILSLSMNEKQDYLISSEYDNKIVICKLQQNKQWLHIQIIQLDTRCWRISFIKNNLFVVQQENGILKTFYQQNINQEFLLHQQLKISEQQSCQYWFPLVYNKKNQLLLNKHHNSIYFMREQNNILTGELSICFEEQDFWGTLSNNSEYLATWDVKSKQIQIRKQK